jgi:HlyD family secretion protein
MKMRTPVWLITGAMALAIGGCVDRQAQQISKKTAQMLGDPVQAVRVQPAATRTIAQTVEVTGDVTAAQDATIGAKSEGKVIAVYVKDGDAVTAGQLLAQLDTSTLSGQLDQANAQVAAAAASIATYRAAVTQAMRNATIGPEKSATAVDQAEAQLHSAQANLDKMLAGPRPQERLQSEAAVKSAKSTLETQQRELERVKTLVAQGALAGNKLDQQQNLVDTAQAQYDNALQSLKLSQLGNREEDIAAARAQVRASQEALKTAKEQQKLDPLMSDQLEAAKAQVEGARAQLEQARAQVRIARQAILDAQIRAPFGGKVFGRPIQPGTIAGSGTAIVRIIGSQGVYFDGLVPSAQITEVHPGLKVQVAVNAFAGKTYSGVVATVSPQANDVGRLFKVRIQFENGMGEIRPGMFATGEVEVRTVPDATVVPSNAIVTAGDKSFVFIVKDGKADRIPVATGIQQGTTIQVTGLPPDAPVVVAGQETLAPGVPVKIETPAGHAKNAADIGDTKSS